MDHPAFKIGMSSDHAVQVIKRTGRKHLLKPVNLGDSEHGYIVRWYLQDATLTFKRLRPTRDGGHYEITEIASPAKINLKEKKNEKDNS